MRAVSRRQRCWRPDPARRAVQLPVRDALEHAERANTGDISKQDGLTVRVETYDSLDGAIYANHATCHPRVAAQAVSPGKPPPTKVGDGDVCWVPMTPGHAGSVLQGGPPPGHHVGFRSEDYQPPALDVVLKIIDRLKQLP